MKVGVFLMRTDLRQIRNHIWRRMANERGIGNILAYREFPCIPYTCKCCRRKCRLLPFDLYHQILIKNAEEWLHFQRAVSLTHPPACTAYDLIYIAPLGINRNLLAAANGSIQSPYTNVWIKNRMEEVKRQVYFPTQMKIREHRRKEV